MAYSPEKISQRNARSSSISTIIGISLVLFMLGALGLIVLNAKQLSERVKENIQIQVYLRDSLDLSKIDAFQNNLNELNFVKSTKVVSSEEAAKVLQDELGEDFVSFLGYNPLSSSIDIYIKANYSSAANMARLERELRQHPYVADVVYSPDLLQRINENINKLAFILLGFSAVLLLISIALINNTIRLAIFSKRFLIKTMQLVGATPAFIRRPFLWQGTLQGLYASLVAMLLLAVLLYGIRSEVPEFFELQNLQTYMQLFGALVALGVAIAWISTFLAVRKYIHIKSDDLF